jgi:uncharacterized membrane protein YhdT
MAADLLDELEELESADTRPRRWALLLLLLPLLAVLWPPLFNRETPTLIGMPFFVWYQLAGVALGGIVTGVVYALSGRT